MRFQTYKICENCSWNKLGKWELKNCLATLIMENSRGGFTCRKYQRYQDRNMLSTRWAWIDWSNWHCGSMFLGVFFYDTCTKSQNPNKIN